MLYEVITYFYECIKVDHDLEQMSIEDIVQLLEDKLKLTNEHIEMIAFVLKEQGVITSYSIHYTKLYDNC